MLNEKGHFFATYLALELAEHTYLDSKDPPYSRLKSPRRIKSTFHSRIDQMEAQGYAVDALRREIMAAKNRRKKVESMSVFGHPSPKLAVD